VAAQGRGQGPAKSHAKASKEHAKPPKDHDQAAKNKAAHKSKVKAKDTQSGKVKANKSGKKAVGTGGDLVLSPVQQRLHDHPRLADRLRREFRDGDLMLGADGFRNLGQFVAAVNVSNNHGIPFSTLKARMVGDGMSLGQAIQAERRDLDSVRLARDAEIYADRLIADSTGTPSRRSRRR
jgi:hypothetical protein